MDHEHHVTGRMGGAGMNHDVLGAILLVGSPAWLGFYVWHSRKVLRGGYDKRD